jgi:hypothetical protein
LNPKVEVNRALLRFFDKDPEDYPEVVDSEFACFKHDMTDALKQGLGGDVYNSLIQEITEEFGYDSPDRARKSPTVVKCLTERARKEGKESETLRKIVECIVSLKGDH